MILPEAEAILRGDDQPNVMVRKATFVGLVDGFAQVDMGASRFVCDFGSGYIPVPGETVRVWTVGALHLVFPAGPRPGVGTVLTVSESTVMVSTVRGGLSMPYAGALSSGDRVGIVWSEDGPWCAGKLSSTPPPPAPPPDPTPPKQTRSATFMAVDAGSTDRNRVRWWTGQPHASDSTMGAWFYGTQIKDTIPANAELVSIEFYVSRQRDQGGAPNFGLHGDAYKGGVPNVQVTGAWDPAGGWRVLPWPEWFGHLKAGGGFYGIGLNRGGYNVFSSLAQDSMSGALRISWR